MQQGRPDAKQEVREPLELYDTSVEIERNGLDRARRA
jgi:hypothetical protein